MMDQTRVAEVGRQAKNVAVLHLKLNKLQYHKNTRQFSKHDFKIFRLYQKGGSHSPHRESVDRRLEALGRACPLNFAPTAPPTVSSKYTWSSERNTVDI